MHSVTAVNVHRFGDGLLVEIVGENEDDVVVQSVELDVIDPDAGIVRPRGALGPGEAMLLEERLSSAGYRIEAAPPTA